MADFRKSRRGWNPPWLEIGPGDMCVRAADVFGGKIPFSEGNIFPAGLAAGSPRASGKTCQRDGNGGGSGSPAIIYYSFKGFRCQMFLLYSSMERSEVNRPEQAVFRTAFRSHRSRLS